MKWKYSITPRVTGKISLPGIQLTITDKFGFFRQQKFVKLRQDLTLLPFMLQPKSTVENVKSDKYSAVGGGTTDSNALGFPPSFWASENTAPVIHLVRLPGRLRLAQAS